MITRLFISSLFFGAIMMNSFAQKIVWKPVENLPVPVRNCRAIGVDSGIYVMGGYTPLRNTNFLYNINNGQWESKSPMITARANFSIAETDGNIYTIGGDLWSNKNEVYNIESDSWTTLSLMPTNRQHITSAVLNNRIHVVGGLGQAFSDDQILNIHEVYDISTNTWDTLAPMLEPYHNLNLSAINGKIYAIGGYGHEGSLWNTCTKIYSYEPDSNKWTYIDEIEELTFVDHTAIVDTIIYLFSSDFPDASTSTIYKYYPGTNKWITCTPLKHVANDAPFIAHKNKLYVFGGMAHGATTEQSIVFEGTIIDTGNYSPSIYIPLKDDSCIVNKNFSYSIPKYAFIDDDTLTFDAGLSDGSDLPDWLIFDTINRVLSGTPVEEGTMEIVITATDNYQESVSDTFNLVIKTAPITGLKQTSDNGLFIYPNPATNRIIVEMNSDYAEFSIMNIHGKVVYHKDLTNNVNYIDLYNYEDGIYFVKIISDNKTYTSKLIITSH